MKRKPYELEVTMELLHYHRPSVENLLKPGDALFDP